jgi:hypothetical protein
MTHLDNGPAPFRDFSSAEYGVRRHKPKWTKVIATAKKPEYSNRVALYPRKTRWIGLILDGKLAT